MEVSVLGPVAVSVAGQPVDLGTPKQRGLVAALALSGGRAVSVDGIVDLLWGEAAPPGVTATLQAYVSQLRRALEPDRPRRAPATVLVTVAPGYALRVPEQGVDAVVFEQAVNDGHRTVQPLADGWRGQLLPADELEEVVTRLDAVLGGWRGIAYADLGDADAAVAERARLEELRLVALEDRALAALSLGRHAPVAAELESLTAAHPLRERMWGLRALALARAGRQADALDALRQVREVLDEELGLEPSEGLRDLQTAVLRQDPLLERRMPEQRPGSPTERVAQQPDHRGPAAAPRPATDRVASWPMVGRDPELAQLLASLDRADAGLPSYAAVTGEPGIGKSRLVAELVAQARERGATVVIGRCSEDEGAPPLWPWRSVLDGLGASLLPEAGATRDANDEGGQFRVWERIVGIVSDAARATTVVVVLDDLHWADPPTLRALRLLVETVDQARLLMVGTWRVHPEPTGPLAGLAESLARMHARRIELAGLPSEEVARVFEAVSSREPTAAQVAALTERTDGNPFFLVEFARLAAERGAPGSGDPLPGAVADVLNRRLLRLPARTVATLRAAAVLGRTFDTTTLAAASGVDEDDVLDVVDPAQAAGLVREDGIDQFFFAHALVRDTLREGLSASRRARVHARAAEALEEWPGRESEVAWHWRWAGPSYADRAWRTAVVAAEHARRYHAYDQAAELLSGALVSLEGDADAGQRDRYDVLMALIDAYRWAARLPDLVAAVEEAIAVATQLDDPELVARAAISTTRDVLWRSAPPGEVNEVVVGALRDSLDRLPTTDSDLRSRALLTLANELDHSAALEERRALCDEGLAMARRLGDPLPVRDACQVWFVALWAPESADERLELITESMELSRQIGSERGHLVSGCLRAGVLNELGRPAEMRAQVEQSTAEAQRLRIGFGEVVLLGVATPWLAMAGRFEEAEDAVARTRELADRMSHGNADESELSSLLALRLWQGRSAEVVPQLLEFDETPYPFHATVAVCWWRAGEHDRARAHYAEHGAWLEHPCDVSLVAWCHAGELALHLGVRSLGAAAYERLVEFAGRSCCGGSYLALGPVDLYLAMAAAAIGEREIAGRHADRALELADLWEIPVVAAWIREMRDTHGY